MSGLTMPAESSLHWQGGSQEAAYRMAVERAAAEPTVGLCAMAQPEPEAEQPERVVMADTDVSVGIEAAGLLHPGLLELELNHCRLGHIGSLAAAPALTRLELRDNGLHGSIEGLEGLSALESLDLQGNRIEKIGSGLALCANLTYLDLSYNALSFKKPEALSAEYLPNLKELFLAQNQIKTWRGLGAVAPSLTQLDVGNNRLKVIGPELGRLVGLQRLFLGANRIAEVEHLGSLQSLTVLSLQSNRLTSARGLETLTSLKELYLSENKLLTLEGLPTSCPSLTILDVANNQIRELSGVTAYPALEDVWANTNRLTQLPETLAELVKLPALTTVYLHYNHWAAAGGAEGEQEHRPVGWSVHYPPKPEELLSKAEYKRQVLEALPKLEQLDDTYR